MVDKMKAAIIYGKEDVRVEDIPIPKIEENEVLVKISYGAICPSDMRYFNGSKVSSIPLILGHEISGEIVEVGDKVKNFEIGTKVVVNSDYKCNTCHYCKKGEHNFCENQILSDGGFAQYKAAPQQALYRIPDHTDLLEASLTEPLACVLNGSNRANIKIGSNVAIIGAGPIGLLHLQVAKLKGALNVVVFEPLDFRREKALELGATHVFESYSRDILPNIEDAIGKRLFDSVIVTIGVKKVMEDVVELVGKNGILMYFAGVHPPAPINIDPNLIHYRQITITGSSDYPLELFEKSLDLIASEKIKTKPIISDVISIDNAKDAFMNSVNKNALKTVIKM